MHAGRIDCGSSAPDAVQEGCIRAMTSAQPASQQRPVARPGHSITVAPTGAESEKSAVPALPVTLDELVTTAKECREAGAAVDPRAHQGRRRPAHAGSGARLADTVHALREATDLIVQLSTGGAVTDSFEPRLAVLDAGPDACSLTCGTVNFGDDVFMNPWRFITELYAKTQALGVVPEFELFDFGHIAALHRLLAELGGPHGGHVHCDLVMGVPGGMPGNAATLVQAACRAAGRARRGRPPGSAAPRCRCCSPRWRRAAICGSAWRTRSTFARGRAGDRATPNW